MTISSKYENGEQIYTLKGTEVKKLTIVSLGWSLEDGFRYQCLSDPKKYQKDFGLVTDLYNENQIFKSRDEVVQALVNAIK